MCLLGTCASPATPTVLYRDAGRSCPASLIPLTVECVSIVRRHVELGTIRHEHGYTRCGRRIKISEKVVGHADYRSTVNRCPANLGCMASTTHRVDCGVITHGATFRFAPGRPDGYMHDVSFSLPGRPGAPHRGVSLGIMRQFRPVRMSAAGSFARNDRKLTATISVRFPASPPRAGRFQ